MDGVPDLRNVSSLMNGPLDDTEEAMMMAVRAILDIEVDQDNSPPDPSLGHRSCSLQLLRLREGEVALGPAAALA